MDGIKTNGMDVGQWVDWREMTHHLGFGREHIDCFVHQEEVIALVIYGRQNLLRRLLQG
jgi:hypothetical protein